jgi:hypothetical protein
LIAVVLCALSGCGSTTVAGHADPQHRAGVKAGPGGVTYDWPPPGFRGAPNTAAFCTLLIDDYQHLKTAQAAGSVATKKAIVGGYVAFSNRLLAAAPPTIASAATTYVLPVTDLLRQLVVAGFAIARVPKSYFAALDTVAVATAQSQLVTFSSRQCHYDLPADSTAAMAPP